MNKDFIFIWYQKIKKKTPSGQIAALLTLVIAIIFIFVAITINIGKVSKTKLLTQIAADSAALNLASILSSIGNYYSQTYLEGKLERCKLNWNPVFSLLLIIFVIISMIFTGPVTLSEILLLLSSALNYVTDVYISTPAMIEAFNRQFRNMPEDVRLAENAIYSALTLLVNDPVFVEDIHDFDEDEDTNDLIYRFEDWYARRLLLIENKTKFIEDFIKRMLPKLKAAHDGLNDLRLYATGDCFSPNPDPECPEGKEFKIWMKEVETGINYKNVDTTTDPPNIYDEIITTDFPFWQEGAENDLIDELISMSADFHFWAWGEYVYNQDIQKIEFVPGILNLSVETLKSTFNSWYPVLLNYTREFNGWMKPIRCWIWNYWGCSDCDHLADDCEVGKVWVKTDREEKIFDDNLRNILVKKIDELKEKLKVLNEKIGFLEYKIGDLEEEIENLEREIKELKKRIEELEAKSDLTEEEKKELEEKKKELADKQEILEDEKQELEDCFNKKAEYGDIKKVIEESIEKLEKHISKLDTAVEKFGNARGGMFALETFISDTVNDEFLKRLNELVDLRTATYSWQDSLGWHHVKIKISDFKIPRIEMYKKRRYIILNYNCAKLINPTGLVTIEVIRYDQDNPVNFASGGPLWNFRIRNTPLENDVADPSNPELALNRGIKSMATIAYGPRLTDIYFK